MCSASIETTYHNFPLRSKWRHDLICEVVFLSENLWRDFPLLFKIYPVEQEEMSYLVFFNIKLQKNLLFIYMNMDMILDSVFGESKEEVTLFKVDQNW